MTIFLIYSFYVKFSINSTKTVLKYTFLSFSIILLSNKTNKKQVIVITKLTVKFSDGVVQNFIYEDFSVILQIITSIKKNCIENNQPIPSFDFDEWETTSKF